ncbi:translation elongation factor Ts [Candidatus Saccharibacteria bacterium]|nr:translation elongation factor Ts [Candidatus Saccharibacteria bacterium]MCB9821325.1 translation elongation factor Ts [Candidatus Nomurabacteria bacterium]
MAKIDISEVKRLRELTGVGITDAKKALEETNGDFDKALEAMRVKGLAKADKRSEREARNGVVGSYVHSDRIGVIVEVNCETDFVARNEEFTSFVKDVAMHIAASSPLYVTREEVPADVVAKEQALVEAELKESGKPAEMIAKIAEGKMDKWYDQVCLLNQAYIKNPDQTVGDYLKERIAKLGENIVVRRFSRIQLGEVE